MTLKIGQRVYTKYDLIRHAERRNALRPVAGTVEQHKHIAGHYQDGYRMIWDDNSVHANDAIWSEASLFATDFLIGDRVRYAPNGRLKSEAIGTITWINPDHGEPYHVRWEHGEGMKYDARQLMKYEESVAEDAGRGEATGAGTGNPSDDEFRQACVCLTEADNAIERRVELLHNRELAYQNLLTDLRSGRYKAVDLPPLLMRGIELRRAVNLSRITKLTALLMTLVETTDAEGP